MEHSFSLVAVQQEDSLIWLRCNNELKGNHCGYWYNPHYFSHGTKLTVLGKCVYIVIKNIKTFLSWLVGKVFFLMHNQYEYVTNLMKPTLKKEQNSLECEFYFLGFSGKTVYFGQEIHLTVLGVCIKRSIKPGSEGFIVLGNCVFSLDVCHTSKGFGQRQFLCYNAHILCQL